MFAEMVVGVYKHSFPDPVPLAGFEVATHGRFSGGRQGEKALEEAREWMKHNQRIPNGQVLPELGIRLSAVFRVFGRGRN
jgi:hypothetical protein